MVSFVLERIALIIFVAAFLFFGFVAGVVSDYVGLISRDSINSAVKLVVDLGRHWRSELGLEPTRFLKKARHDGSGVTRLVPEHSFAGLTLVSGLFDDEVALRLIDLDGTVVNQWPVPFDRLMRDIDYVAPASDRPTHKWGIFVHGAVMLPDGSVVFNVSHLKLVKLGRCGQVEWIVPRMTHHSVFPTVDGAFWVPSKLYHNPPPESFRSLSSWVHEDTLLKVASDGTILQEISVMEILERNGLFGLLGANGRPSPTRGGGFGWRDPVHLNDLDVLGAPLSLDIPGVNPGDIMISARNLDLVLIFDPATLEVRWWQKGPWVRQHDPEVMRDGRIAVFNNNRDKLLAGGSTILAIDPVTRRVNTLYPLDTSHEFYTDCCGKLELLENDNLLITIHEEGRIIEVTPSGEIVWQFINRYDEDRIAYVYDGIRYPRSYFQEDAFSCPKP